MSNYEGRGFHPILEGKTDQELDRLCHQLREELIQNTARTGGHLASNLGTVELMVAIHRVFDTEKDRLVFDVGHQCYVHKMLTGRGDQMETLRQWGGIAGFPKPEESIHDAFIAGHASNSVAVSVGMAQARTILQQDYRVIALLGDGALTGGLAYEGLANGEQCKQLLVILNDNGMSITQNVGGVAEHLAKQRLKPQYLSFKQAYRRVMSATWLGRKCYRLTHQLKRALKQSLLPCSMFENMGFLYLGPVDGHDLTQLTKIMRYAASLQEPVLLHVRTQKGKGFSPAEKNPDAFHGVAPYDPATGTACRPSGTNFSAIFGEALVRLGQRDGRICAITAAMVSGTGLVPFAEAFPDRFFDVGIAEGCGVSMASGMAKQGAIPVFSVYSTFLQRGYDMLIHDMGISNLHVVLAVDRAGLVGEDGETHHGIFDVAYLSTIPGVTIYAPSSYSELRSMLEWGMFHHTGPVAIRYPRGGEGEYTEDAGLEAEICLKEGKDLTLVSYGMEMNEVLQAARLLEKEGVEGEVIKLNRIAPLELEKVCQSVQKTGRLLVAEECIHQGCVGQSILAHLEARGISGQVALVNCGTNYVPHGSVAQLKQYLGLDPRSLFQKGMEVMGDGR